MTDRKLVVLLVVSIILFSGLLIYVLDSVGVMQAEKYLPFLKQKQQRKLVDIDHPNEVDKMTFRKIKEMLLEKEEEMVKKEVELQALEDELNVKQKGIDDLHKNIEEEKTKLKMMTKDLGDRQTKVADLASKVTNMDPIKAREMMESWRDFDIIDVMRQIDKSAEAEGVPSITPYLLTLFTPERRAEITRKMLLPPVEQE